MDNAIQRLRAARTALVLDAPFYGMLACRLTLVADTGKERGTMATDGQNLYYDTAFVKSCSDDELIWLWAHEVTHPAMHHHTRRGQRDPDLWNIAADHAENHMLTGIGSMPKGSLLDPAFKGMSAEQIYAALEQQQQEKSDEKEPHSGGGAGGQDGEGEDQGEPGDDRQPAPGGVLDAPDPAQDEVEWTVAVTQAANAAQMMGKMPGGMKALVAEMTRARTDWRSLLRRFVQQACAADYSWRMPNRRYLQQGLYMPAVRSEQMGRMLVFVDSSGSTQPFITAFKGELQAVKDEMQPEELIVVMVDAAVQRVDRFARDEPVEFNLTGGGGTDFRPAFEWAQKEEIEPVCALYLSDGEGRFPDSPPDYPVLWAITTSIVAPFGETIRLETD